MSSPVTTTASAIPIVRKADPLAPTYPTEAAALANGWKPVTSYFVLHSERPLAERTLASLRGKLPGQPRVDVVVIGTDRRVCFARREQELRGLDVHGDHEADQDGVEVEARGPYARPLHPEDMA